MRLARGLAFRWLFVAASLCLSAGISGCAAVRANPSWRVPAAPAAGSKELVYYATDRERAKLVPKCRPGETPTAQPMYGSADRADGQLLYGEFSVRLPETQSYGNLVAYHPRPECLRSEADPVFLTGPIQHERAAFFAALRRAAEASAGKQVLVFVHGYDFEFDESILWTAQLKRYLEVDAPVVVYDWASKGDLLAYREDEQAVERSAPRLEAFLRDLHAESAGMHVDVLAHSIGNRLLLNALVRMAQQSSGPMFRNLILSAPDVSTARFVDQIAGATKLAHRTTLYVSSEDRALFASQRLHKDFRAGRDLILVAGVDTVDVSPVDTSRTKHSYYIENRWVLDDLNQILRDDAPPARRFGLIEMHAGDATFWQFRP